jgi:uncharacterized protein YbcI
MTQVSSPASQAMAITEALISIKKRRTGRGSPKARTFVSNDFLVCIQRDGLTPAERTLREAGKAKDVKQLRDALRERLRDDFVPMIEKLTGRPVISFLSDYDVEQDISVDCFVLEPGYNGSGSAALPDPAVIDAIPA